MCWPHASGIYFYKIQQQQSVGNAYMSVNDCEGSMYNISK